MYPFSIQHTNTLTYTFKHVHIHTHLNSNASTATTLTEKCVLDFDEMNSVLLSVVSLLFTCAEITRC